MARLGRIRARVSDAFLQLALVETLWTRGWLAKSTAPVVEQWFRELQARTRDLRGRRPTEIEFQDALEQLFRRVDLVDLCRVLKVDDLCRNVSLPARGAAKVPFGLKHLLGLPPRPAFRQQLFLCARGRSIIPHGHANMCTGFLVLQGSWRGRHYDRLATDESHYIIRPTVDRTFVPGDASTVSDRRDNVHWFTATSDVACIFNVLVARFDGRQKGYSGRLYLDPEGERLADGTIRAAKMSLDDCNAKYG